MITAMHLDAFDLPANDILNGSNVEEVQALVS